MKTISISDPTLRDGNHAVGHQLRAEQIAAYCKAADVAGIHVVEVGHGNGLGGSSLQLGESACIDEVALRTAREALGTSKLGVHVIPGLATIWRDLSRALELGVDVVRVASHCTEADLTERHIAFTRERCRTAYGVLMMSHMASKERLVEEAAKMVSYGAQGIIIMDSAGSYFPADVTERIGLLVRELGVMVGFHAHNNLGMAIANSVAAIEAGATMLDGCARGFGAGAGNAQLEVLVPVVERLGYETGLDLYKLLDAADLAEREIIPAVPTIRSTSIVSGLAGVFSGFAKPVERIAKHYGVDPRDVFFELGRRRIVAGQEDMILEVASDLAKRVHAPAEARA
jgi:4-hydroxy 2-oxovalerate aldolase